MISFKKFVDGIHDAVHAANESLLDKNSGILDAYFMRTSEDEKVITNLESAIEASNSLIKKEGSLTREDFQNASQALERAKNALVGLAQKSEKDLAEFGNLSPRVVTVEYPYQKEDGTIGVTPVQVPLITMTPITMTHIERAVMKANFDMEIVDDELQLTFTNRANPSMGKRSKITRGQLEVTIAPTETADGLSQLIEGYERVLKSQIPN